jgi:inorganic triphosphatase YgiF
MWPVSALDRARQVLARAFGALGELVRNAAQPLVDARLTAVQSVVQARHFVSIAAFETRLLKRDRRESFEEKAVRSLDRLAAAAFVVAAQPHQVDFTEAARTQDARASTWFADTARRFAKGQTPPAPPDRTAIVEARTSLPASAPSPLRAALEARVFLQQEIEDVASKPI